MPASVHVCMYACMYVCMHAYHAYLNRPKLNRILTHGRNRQAYARLDAVITVVDAKHVIQHLDEKKAEGAENECVEQVVFADRILLNKTDLVEADYLDVVEGRLRDINKVCDIIRCCKANVPLDKLLGIGAFDLKRIEAFAPDFLQEDAPDEHGSHGHGHTHSHHHHTHDSAISSVGILQEGNLNLDRLNAWMGKLLKDKGADIYRSKGVLSISTCARPS